MNHQNLSIEQSLAAALCSVMPCENKSNVDWRLVADEFVCAIAGSFALVPRRKYDRMARQLEDTQKLLMAFGVRIETDV